MGWDDTFPIRCSHCQTPTGAWWDGGEPLPWIICSECHEMRDPDRDDR